MHFNKYDDFINENKEARKRRKAKKLEEEALKAEKEGDKEKKEKLLAKSAQKLKEADAIKQKNTPTEEPKKEEPKKEEGVDTETTEPTDKKEEGTETGTETETDTTDKEEVNKEKVSDEGTNGKKKDDFSKMSPEELNKRLTDWNKVYAQAFKFENDMPKKPTSNVADLINVISGSYKTLAKEGISNIVKFFKNPSFNEQDIEISGYTSTTGSDTYNKSLSDRRAESVLNAIKAQMKDTGVETKINFITIGHGEDKNHLMILNDTENGTPDTIKKGNNVTISDDKLADITTPEKRQEVNRRVEIILKEFSPVKRDIGEETPIVEPEKKKEKVVEKPEAPNPEKLEFNLDSYILTKESEKLLESFASDVKKWNTNKEGDDKIKTIYISSHTQKVTDDDKKQEKIQDKFLAHLSNNRAYTVKRFLQIEIGEDISKDIAFFSYPVAFNMGREKKVEIHFDNSKHMQEAKNKFSEMAKKYDIKEGKRGYGGNNYTLNEAERYRVIFNLKDYAKKGRTGKTIPLELWYSSGRFGLGYEEDFDKFKEEMKKICEKSRFRMSAEDYVFKSI